MFNLHPKVATGGIAGAVSILLPWALSLAGITVSPEVASALTTVTTFVAGYLQPADKTPPTP